MKKRFAMMIAGILMAAMLAASAALSLGLLGASTASAGGDRKAPRSERSSARLPSMRNTRGRRARWRT